MGFPEHARLLDLFTDWTSEPRDEYPPTTMSVYISGHADFSTQLGRSGRSPASIFPQ